MFDLLSLPVKTSKIKNTGNRRGWPQRVKQALAISQQKYNLYHMRSVNMLSSSNQPSRVMLRRSAYKREMSHVRGLETPKIQQALNFGTQQKYDVICKVIIKDLQLLMRKDIHESKTKKENKLQTSMQNIISFV